MMKRVKKKIVFFSFVILLLSFHLTRDLLQVFGAKIWLTELWHETWIKASNNLLGLIHLSYGKWAEWPMIGIEAVLVWVLGKRRKTLKYIYNRLME
ncbi:hypothetical protein KKC08_00390 [Patescibacteria group bacterium]|nr:hypothetical protein [Patescibacteria group bacterium]MBU4396613.1 hypothetical protein [Patescibacteria group bacterium]MBU4431103.1 hypothetical protein [Patescibacteria group bacterium]MCG2701862.1 hypothetical protein [Candidatus Parcubacteria bacterium]